MPRHGNVQHDFYRIALLPLEIDLAHGDFSLLQPVIQAHKVAFPSVRPTTPPRCTKITPAPRKPIPAAMLAATRETSTETPAAPTIGRKPYEETSVISAAPSETIMCVREPAPFMRVCRSTPISRPQTAATISRTRQIIRIFSGVRKPLPNKSYRSNDRYRVPWKVSLPVSPSASIPYSKPETWNSIRSPLST